MTAQFHENLILDGEDTSMAYCPPLPPEGDDRVRLQEGASEDDWECTACWRGYVATWEIRDDKIYLNKFSRKYVIEEGHPLFADWISETIRIPQGEQLEYVHMGFGSVYEQDLMIRIEKGVVVERRVVDNREGLQKMSNEERKLDSDQRGWREIFNTHAWGGGHAAGDVSTEDEQIVREE